MLTVRMTTATGSHETLQIPCELEGETAVESAANFLREVADVQKQLPAAIRSFRPPLTIVIEEIPELAVVE